MINWTDLIPFLFLCGLGLALVLVESFLTKFRRDILLGLTAGGFAATGLLWIGRVPFWTAEPSVLFGGALGLDAITAWSGLLILGIALLISLASDDYIHRRDIPAGEYYSLLILTCAAMLFLAASRDLLFAFVSLEFASLGVYCMVGLDRGSRRSGEAALKYFLLGAFAAAFLLYGMAFLYGETGSTLIPDRSTPPGTYLTIGSALFLIGVGFKIGMVPFHMWVPDAYQGAPTPVTGWISTAFKTAAFVFLIRFAASAPVMTEVRWMTLFQWLAVATMIVGNVLALRQTDLKRLLAYSSIAHTGYLMVGMLAYWYDLESGAGPILFYLGAYAAMNVGAFSLLSCLRLERGDLEEIRGLASRRPVWALAFSILMVSLAGFPPTLGFFGKAVLFGAAVHAGFVGLAVIAVLGSLVSLYYYLRPVMEMYMKKSETEAWFGLDRYGMTVGLACTLLVALGGLCPAVWELLTPLFTNW